MGDLIKFIVKAIVGATAIAGGVTVGKKGLDDLGNFKKTAGGNSNAGSNQQ